MQSPDKKILVTEGVPNNGKDGIGLLCLNTNGTPDSRFGTDGIVHYQKTGYDYVWGQTFTPENKILVVETIEVFGLKTTRLLCYYNNGIPDLTFGNNGSVTFETIGIGPLYAMEIGKDGSAIASEFIAENMTNITLLLKISP